MTRFNKNNIKKGFTLVELIVVIAIVAILSAVSVAGYYGFMAYGNQSAADQEAAQFKKSVTGQFTLKYSGKTAQNSGVSGTVSKNGIKLSKETGDSPVSYVTSMLAEAYTYSENPAAFQSVATFDFSQVSIIAFDGSETDGVRPSLLSPKVAMVDEEYYITEITYQAKNSYKSVVSFTNLEGQEVAPSVAMDMSKEASGLSNVKGLKDSYAANEVVDFSNVTATVSFTDGSSMVVGSESLEFEETTSVSPKMQRSVSTTRSFTVTYKHGHDAAPVSAPVSKPKTAPLTQSDVTEIKLPQNVELYKKTMSISEDSFAGFKKDTSEDAGFYFVGKQNGFKYLIDVLCLDNAGRVSRLDPSSLNPTYQVRAESSSEFTNVPNDGNVLNFSSFNEGRYVLRTVIGGKTLDLNIKVIDAWNVYTPEDLKKFDNTRPDCYDYTTGTTRTSTFNTTPRLKQFVSPYLKWNGTEIIPTNDNDTTSSVHGIVLQNSIKIRPNLFDRHVYASNGKIIRDRESSLGGNSQMHLFKRHLSVGEKFYFEGNYFTVDASSMPWMDLVLDEKGWWPELFAYAHDYVRDTKNPSDIHGGSSWYEAYNERINVIGNGGKVDNLYATGSLILFNNKNAKVCDFNYVNMSKGNYGINGYQNGYEMTISNCKLSNFFTTALCSDGMGARSHIARVLATSGLYTSLESTDTTKYDPRATELTNESQPADRIASIDSRAGVHVTNSIIRDSGGPAIVLETTGDSSRSESWESFPTIDIDSSTEIISYITGSEPFFVVQGLANEVVMVKALDAVLAGVTSNRYSIVNNGYFNCAISLTSQGRAIYDQALNQDSFDADYQIYKFGYPYATNCEVIIDGQKHIDFNGFLGSAIATATENETNPNDLISSSMALVSKGDSSVAELNTYATALSNPALEVDGSTINGNTQILIDGYATGNPNPYAPSANLQARGTLYGVKGVIAEQWGLGDIAAKAQQYCGTNLLPADAQWLGIELPVMGLVMGLFNK